MVVVIVVSIVFFILIVMFMLMLMLLLLPLLVRHIAQPLPALPPTTASAAARLEVWRGCGIVRGWLRLASERWRPCVRAAYRRQPRAFAQSLNSPRRFVSLPCLAPSLTPQSKMAVYKRLVSQASPCLAASPDMVRSHLATGGKRVHLGTTTRRGQFLVAAKPFRGQGGPRMRFAATTFFLTHYRKSIMMGTVV